MSRLTSLSFKVRAASIARRLAAVRTPLTLPRGPTRHSSSRLEATADTLDLEVIDDAAARRTPSGSEAMDGFDLAVFDSDDEEVRVKL